MRPLNGIMSNGEITGCNDTVKVMDPFSDDYTNDCTSVPSVGASSHPLKHHSVGGGLQGVTMPPNAVLPPPRYPSRSTDIYQRAPQPEQYSQDRGINHSWLNENKLTYPPSDSLNNMPNSKTHKPLNGFYHHTVTPTPTNPMYPRYPQETNSSRLQVPPQMPFNRNMSPVSIDPRLAYIDPYPKKHQHMYPQLQQSLEGRSPSWDQHGLYPPNATAPKTPWPLPQVPSKLPDPRLGYQSRAIFHGSGTYPGTMNCTPPPSQVSPGILTGTRVPKQYAASSSYVSPPTVQFPPDSVEATQSVCSSRSRVTARNLGPIEALKLLMSLKSGLLAETTWALDTMAILLFDSETVKYFRLKDLPGMLDVLIEHWKVYLNIIYGLFEGTIPKLTQESTNDNDQIIPMDCSDSAPVHPCPKAASQFTPREHQVVIKASSESRSFKEAALLSELDDGNEDTHEPEDGRRFVFSDHMVLPKGALSTRKRSSSTNFSTALQIKRRRLDFPKELSPSGNMPRISCDPFEQPNLTRLLDRSCLERIIRMHIRRNPYLNNSHKLKQDKLKRENDEVSRLMACDDLDVLSLLAHRRTLDDNIESALSFSELKNRKEKYRTIIIEESRDYINYDEHIFSSLNEDRQDLLNRCLSVGNIIRGFSALPDNALSMSSHVGLLRLFSELLLFGHSHLERGDRGRIGFEHIQSHDVWRMHCLDGIREHILVTLANISGQFAYSELDSELVLALFDGLLHWIICPSVTSVDPIPGSLHSSLSCQRLALEILTKLSIVEGNTDLILATPPLVRIEHFITTLSDFLSPQKERAVRELSLILLSNLCQNPDAISMANITHICLENTLLFLEECCELLAMAQQTSAPDDLPSVSLFVFLTSGNLLKQLISHRLKQQALSGIDIRWNVFRFKHRLLSLVSHPSLAGSSSAAEIQPCLATILFELGTIQTASSQ